MWVFLVVRHVKVFAEENNVPQHLLLVDNVQLMGMLTKKMINVQQVWKCGDWRSSFAQMVADGKSDVLEVQGIEGRQLKAAE